MNALMNIMIRLRAASAQAEVNKLRAEIARLESQIKTAKVQTNSLFGGGSLQAINKWGSRVQWAGRQLTANFTMPIGLAGGAATKWALESEAAMVRVEKVYGDGATDLSSVMKDKLATAFDLLSAKYAVQISEVRNIAGEWAAAGAKGEGLARGVEETLRTMVLGEFSAAEATEALISIQAQYGANTKELTRIVDVFNATENATGITFKGLVQGASRAASSARDAGVDIEHLSAMMAALTPASGSATQAGNALKTMISRLLSPTKEAREVLGMMGMQMSDVEWKSLTGSQRLEVLARAYHNLEGSSDGFVSSQAAVVSSVVASRYQINRFSTLMRDMYASIDKSAKTNGYYGKTLDILKDQNRVAATAISELDKVLKSSPMTMKRAGVMLQNSFIKIINQIMPQILTFATAIEKMADKFAKLNPTLQKLIILFLVFLAVLGPPLSMLGATAVAFSQMGMMIGGVLKPLRFVIGLFKGVGAASAIAAAGTAAAAGTSVGSSATVAAAAAGSASAVGTSQARITVSTAAMHKKLQAGTGAVVKTFGRVMTSSRVLATRVQMNLGMMATAASYQMGRMAYGTQVTMTKTMPAAAAKGMAAVNHQVFKGGTLMTTILSRSLFDNLTAMSFYVDASVASLGRGLAKMKAMGVTAAASATALGAKGVTSRAGMAATGAAAAGGSASVAAGAAMGTTAAAKKLSVAGSSMVATVKSWGPKLMGVLKTWGPKLLRFFVGPWGLAISAVLGLLALFKDQIADVWNNIKNMFSRGGGNTLQLPVGDFGKKEFENSLNGFSAAWSKIKTLFRSGIEYVHKGFATLPKGVQGALSAVVRMVGTAAKKVYELFSYINPWAHHSPSLVENVTSGMGKVGKIFGLSVGNIRKHMRAGYAELARFGKAVASFMKQYENMQHKNNIEVIGEAAGKGAVAAYNKLRATLGPLYKDLERVGAAMAKQQIKVDGLARELNKLQKAADKAQKKLDDLTKEADKLQEGIDAANSEIDRYASSGIVGMKAMNDQIFDNEMAQKKLRLEMLKMGDIDVDKLRDKLAGIQGDIDNLRGEQADLRASGAGSDILGTYDAMIAELEGQQKVINQSVAPYNELEKQLEDLEKQGEILDLEKSIQFDPLTKQIEELTSGYSELPFDQIVNGIKEQQAVVDDLTPKLEAVNEKIAKQQENVDRANAAVEKANEEYEKQNAILEVLQNTYAGIETEIRAIEEAMSNLVSAAEAMKAAMEEAKRAKDDALSPGAENFLDAAGGSYPDPGDFNTIGDEGEGDIDSYIDKLTEDVSNLLGNLDLLGPLKVAWGKVTAWWDANIMPIIDDLKRGFSEMFAGVDFTAPFKKIKEWFETSPVGQMVAAFAGEIWENIKGLGTAIVDALSPMIEPIRDSIKPLLEALGRLFTKVIWPAIKKVARIVAGALGAALAGAMIAFNLIVNILKNTVGPIFKTIGNTISGFLKVVTGVVDAVVKLFKGDFKGAFSALGGAAKTAIDTILGFFRGIGETIWGILKGAGEHVGELLKTAWNGFGKDVMDKFLGGITTAWTAVKDWFSDLGSKISTAVGDTIDTLKSKGSDFLDGVYNGVTGAWGKVKTWFSNLKTTVSNVIGSTVTTLKTKGVEFLTGVYNGIVEKWNAVKAWFADLKNKVSNTIGSTVSTLKTKGIEFLIGVYNGVTERWTKVKAWFSDLKTKVSNTIGSTVSTLKTKGIEFLTGVYNGVTERWVKVKEWFNGLKERTTSAIGSTASTLKSKGTDFISGVHDGVTSRWTTVKTWFGNLGTKVKAAVGGTLTMLYSSGYDTISGFLNGIKEKAKDIVSTIKTFVTDKIPKVVRDALDIKSPSRVMAALGRFIPSGLAVGIQSNAVQAVKAMGALVSDVSNAADFSGISIDPFDMLTGNILGDVNAAMRTINTSATATTATMARGIADGVNAALGATATMGNAGDEKTYNFYGNLEFPNISNPDDAQQFLDNLELAAGGATR